MTMNTTTLEQRVRDFVAAVGEHFPDLKVNEREELLADLEQHLTELAADAPDALERELGDPAGYAAELRSGAGLSESHRRRGRASAFRTALDDRVRAIVDHPRMTPMHEYLPTLLPAWWIVRAWAPVALLGMAVGGGTPAQHVFIPGRSFLGLVVLIAATTFSVRAGMRGMDSGRSWRIGTRLAALATAMVVLLAAAVGASSEAPYVESFNGDFDQTPLLTHPDGEGITNLFVYDVDGSLLSNVRIYDGAGRPVEVGPNVDEWFGIRSELVIDSDGRALTNLYPIQQYVLSDDGSLRLRDAPVVVPILLHAPLIEPVDSAAIATPTTTTPSTTEPASVPNEPPLTQPTRIPLRNLAD